MTEREARHAELAERFLAVFEGKELADSPPVEVGGVESDPDTLVVEGSSHARVDGDVGEDEPGDAGESDEVKADLGRLENLFRAAGRD